MKKNNNEFINEIAKKFEEEEGRKPTKEEMDFITGMVTLLNSEAHHTDGKSYYHYDRPDYSQGLTEIIAPLDVLAPGYNKNKDTDFHYKTIRDKTKMLPHEEQAAAVTNLIMHHLAAYHATEENGDIWVYPLQTAVALVGDLGLRECLPAVLELLRQDKAFMVDIFEDDKLEDMLGAAIYQAMAKDDLPKMFNFMLMPGLLFENKQQVALAAGTFIRKDPEATDAVKLWLSSVLEAYEDIGADTDVWDGLLLDCLAYCCIHCRAVELKKTLIRFYSKFNISKIYVPDGANEVRKTIKTASIGALEDFQTDAAEMLIDHYYRHFDFENDDEEEDDDDYDDNDEDYDDDESEGIEDFNPEDYDWNEYRPWARHAVAEYAPVLTTNQKMYTLHVTLDGVKPDIYRDLRVPSNLKLTSLAAAILVAMGWDEDHLHQFIVRGKSRRDTKCYATSDNEIGELMDGSYDGSRYTIGDILKVKGKDVIFEYDYGDSWYHRVTLNAIEPCDGKPQVSLIDGKRACPPEDCGGIPGYMRLCQAMQHLDDPDAQELIDWLGTRYDPEAFPLPEAQTMINAFN